ncbi:hypothetical protein GGU10DRAFT_336248 [Lentinula aff. detonsa]|uniref:Uncharacterized protein n=1 Tax=Lentinula aff. detonsa TaxID=2804958 RepID=A0AA38KDV6_9AGAR|nr:hypothetical protein GGU10DRAFT_336248 [Lentinula aff. detonsa]
MDSPNEMQGIPMSNETTTVQPSVQGPGGMALAMNTPMREGNRYMNWPSYPGPIHPGFNPMYMTPYSTMISAMNPHLGMIPKQPPTTITGNSPFQQNAMLPMMSTSQYERAVMNPTPVTSTTPNSTHRKVDSALNIAITMARAIGIMKALAVHEYFTAKRTGDLDPFKVSREPEIEGTLYIPPPPSIDSYTHDWYTNKRGRRGAPPGNRHGGTGRSHPYTPRTLNAGDLHNSSILTEQTISTTVKTSPKRNLTLRYIPHFGSIDPEPFEDGEERFVAIRNLHYRPGHGPAPGFIWDININGKLQEDRGRLGPRSYDMGEKVEPMPAPGIFTRKARNYPGDEHSARETISHGHTEGSITGFYTLIDIHRAISLRRLLERESGVSTVTVAEGIVEAEFSLPPWAKRSIFMDGHGVSSKENVYDWPPIRVPSVEQPHLINSSDRHYAYWVAVHGTIIDHPGIFITDSGFIDLDTVAGHRLLRALDYAPSSESSSFKELFITLLTLPKCYSQVVDVHRLNITPTTQPMACPYEPKTIVDVARHMANCGITESQADSLLQYARFFCIDKLQSKLRSENETGPWLRILRRSNLRMLVTDCVPERDPTLELPAHWNRDDLKEYRRRRAVIHGQKSRGQLPLNWHMRHETIPMNPETGNPVEEMANLSLFETSSALDDTPAYLNSTFVVKYIQR